MKITATKLKNHIKRSGLSVIEITNRMNVLQKQLFPKRRPMTINGLYFALAGHTPSLDKIYYLAAILKTHPKNLFGVVYNEPLLKEYTKLSQEIN